MKFFREPSIDTRVGTTGVEQKVEGACSVDGDGYDDHGLSGYPEFGLHYELAKSGCESGDEEDNREKPERTAGSHRAHLELRHRVSTNMVQVPPTSLGGILIFLC